MRNLTLMLVLAGSAVIPVIAGATAPAKNGQIAFRRFFDDAHRRGAIFLVNPDGTGERQLTHPPAGSIDARSGPPSFAPDGSKLLFTRSPQRGNDALWTVDLRNGRERRLIPGRKRGSDHGVYSPNGRRIAFALIEGPLEHNNLRVSLDVLAAGGRRVRRLVDLNYKGDLGRIAWSPDGRRIVYEVARPTGHALFVIASRGGRPHRIGPSCKAEFNTLDWSPDGRRLLIQLTPLDSSFGGDYYTLRPNGTGLHRLTHFGTKATTGSAAWSPDGKSIVFANAGAGGNDDIYVMHADGSSATPVTRTPTWESAPAWGPAR
jgi:Tol biopolymer transport system component